MAAWACDSKSEAVSKSTAFSWFSGFVSDNALALEHKQRVDIGEFGKKRVVDRLLVT